MPTPRRFAISASLAFAALASIMGMRRKAEVIVSDDTVEVRMGWAFSARIPRSAITRVAAHPPIRYAIGVHGWRGSWIVNGTTGNVVDIAIDPPVRARAVLFPTNLRRVRVSVDEPAELIRALQPTTSA
ncbi:MAG TPA: hypothetical protein VFZ83_09815 [Acidimicrobiia bacterium]|nr:hypothetical protein [Acidimicrobiia bacterium]